MIRPLMEKEIGESNVQSAFLAYLKSKIGPAQKMVESDLAGKRDTTFADYFASLNAKNILIEFKEFDLAGEAKKPLRETLCRDIPSDMVEISGECHFISWRKNVPGNLCWEMDFYLRTVCPLFEIEDFESEMPVWPHDAFVDAFIAGNIGAEVARFKKYAEYLAQLAADSGISEARTSFVGVLLSLAEDGTLQFTPFYSLTELVKVISEMDIDPPSQKISSVPLFPGPMPEPGSRKITRNSPGRGMGGL